jgi:hypothetical protein
MTNFSGLRKAEVRRICLGASSVVPLGRRTVTSCWPLPVFAR